MSATLERDVADAIASLDLSVMLKADASKVYAMDETDSLMLAAVSTVSSSSNTLLANFDTTIASAFDVVARNLDAEQAFIVELINTKISSDDMAALAAGQIEAAAQAAADTVASSALSATGATGPDGPHAEGPQGDPGVSGAQGALGPTDTAAPEGPRPSRHAGSAGGRNAPCRHTAPRRR